MLGLFDVQRPAPADRDDDASGVGLLSRLLVRIRVDGTYSVGVVNVPGSHLHGRRGRRGRYVLNISSYRGTILPSVTTTAVEVPLIDLQFPFQGTYWSSVFVNGNGNLTFGASDADFTETVPELLTGPPRIAPLWDDLFRPGRVVAEETDRELRVHFVSVPEFLAAGTNYFSVTLTETARSLSTTPRRIGATASSASPQGWAPPTRSGRSFGGAGTGRDWDDVRAVRPSIVRHMVWCRSVVQGIAFKRRQ